MPEPPSRPLRNDDSMRTLVDVDNDNNDDVVVFLNDDGVGGVPNYQYGSTKVDYMQRYSAWIENQPLPTKLQMPIP
jgi:hypothetical protein